MSLLRPADASPSERVLASDLLHPGLNPYGANNLVFSAFFEPITNARSGCKQNAEYLVKNSV